MLILREEAIVWVTFMIWDDSPSYPSKLSIKWNDHEQMSSIYQKLKGPDQLSYGPRLKGLVLPKER